MSDDEDNEKIGKELGPVSTEDLIKYIYNPRYVGKEENKNSVEEANKYLEKEYLSIGFSSAKTVVSTLVLLYILDNLIYVHPVVYGACLNTLGALFMVYPRFSGRYKIAALVEENREAQMIARAENTAYSNVGLLFLISGFLVQIAIFQSTMGAEIVGKNSIDQLMPWWGETLSVFTIFIISLPLGFANWRWWFGLTSTK